jgi:hypothetical protein
MSQSLVVDPKTMRWRAQENNVIGGWCVTPADDPRTPADGVYEFADFLTRDMAEHIANLHNAWLETQT